MTRREFLKMAWAAAMTFFFLGFQKGSVPEPVVQPDPQPEKIAHFVDPFEVHTQMKDGLRVLKLGEAGKTATATLKERVQTGEAFVPGASTAVLAEVMYLWELSEASKLDVCATGILDGLKATYKTDAKMAVALWPGHFSFPSETAITKYQALRKAGSKINLTRDTGTAEGKLTEMDANFEICRLVAVKMAKEKLPWIPVFVSDKNGYQVDPLREPRTDDEFCINAADAELPALVAFENLAADLGASGVPTVRLGIHFNSSEDKNVRPRPRGGIIFAQNFGPFENESRLLADNITAALGRHYHCEANHVTNEPQKPFWMLAASGTDNPADVAAGNWPKVRGLPNRVLAWLKNPAIAGRQCSWGEMIAGEVKA